MILLSLHLPSLSIFKQQISFCKHHAGLVELSSEQGRCGLDLRAFTLVVILLTCHHSSHSPPSFQKPPLRKEADIDLSVKNKQSVIHFKGSSCELFLLTLAWKVQVLGYWGPGWDGQSALLKGNYSTHTSLIYLDQAQNYFLLLQNGFLSIHSNSRTTALTRNGLSPSINS